MLKKKPKGSVFMTNQPQIPTMNPINACSFSVSVSVSGQPESPKLKSVFFPLAPMKTFACELMSGFSFYF